MALVEVRWQWRKLALTPFLFRFSVKYVTISLIVHKMVSRNCPLFCVLPYVVKSKQITCKSLWNDKQRYSLSSQVSCFSAVLLYVRDVFFGMEWWSKGPVRSKCTGFQSKPIPFVACESDSRRDIFKVPLRQNIFIIPVVLLLPPVHFAWFSFVVIRRNWCFL